jgi:hypothetical protein
MSASGLTRVAGSSSAPAVTGALESATTEKTTPTAPTVTADARCGMARERALTAAGARCLPGWRCRPAYREERDMPRHLPQLNPW